MKNFIINKLRELDDPSKLLTQVCQKYKVVPEPPECETNYYADGGIYIVFESNIEISVDIKGRCSVFNLDNPSAKTSLDAAYGDNITLNQFCDLVVLCSLL